jgi:hypothetical protein
MRHATLLANVEPSLREPLSARVPAALGGVSIFYFTWSFRKAIRIFQRPTHGPSVWR